MAFWEQNSSRLKIAKTVFASSRVVCPKRFGNIVEDRPTAWHSGTDSGMQTPATQSKEKVAFVFKIQYTLKIPC